MKDPLPEIEKALKGKTTSAILCFGPYRITEPLGGGGQGRVYKVEHPIKKAFALKLYHGVPEETVSQQENWENFKREVGILAGLNHKNIVGIKSAGLAELRADGSWHVTEGLPDTASPVPNRFFFYVMDYAALRARDMFPILNKRWQEGQPMVAEEFDRARIQLFERLARHILDAISCCHLQVDPLTHKDIKGDNILFRREDNNFVLADFGFARHFDSKDQDEMIRRFETASAGLIHEHNYKANDLYEIATVLLRLLPALREDYDDSKYYGIRSVLQAVVDRPKEAHLSASSMKRDLERYFARPGWELRLKLGSSLVENGGKRFVFNGKIRIPVSGSLVLTEAIRDIIDTSDFQRLRGVRQLGPTYFVFPGAFHSRFEHSIGAYHLSLRYLEALTRVPEFNSCNEPIERTIKTTVLAALLHDVGHYPYSHWVEEIDSFPNCPPLKGHEERAVELIEQGPLANIIASWGLDPCYVTNVIHPKQKRDHIQQTVDSVLSSVLDIDKLDYLVRDSIHCGVNYGSGLDVERLLDSLHYDRRFGRVCLNTKSRSHLLSLLACRNTMYQEVYWHKTVRACTGMFKRFFYHMLECGAIKASDLKGLFESADDVFTWKLHEAAQSHRDLLPLVQPLAFKGRRLYKAAYIFAAGSGLESPEANGLFEHILKTKRFEDWIETTKNLVRELRVYCPEITDTDIVIEATPLKEADSFDLARLRLWNARRQDFETLPKRIDGLNEYLKDNRQAFLFCSEKHYVKLKSIPDAEWAKIFAAVH